MTKDEKIADIVWYYVEEYVSACKGDTNGVVSPRRIANEAKRLDRAIRMAARSKSK